jgi:hypothetical protein
VPYIRIDPFLIHLNNRHPKADLTSYSDMNIMRCNKAGCDTILLTIPSTKHGYKAHNSNSHPQTPSLKAHRTSILDPSGDGEEDLFVEMAPKGTPNLPHKSKSPMTCLELGCHRCKRPYTKAENLLATTLE